MKDLLKQYASYNTWANQQLVDLLVMLPKEILMKEIASSFRSLHLTLLHMLDVEQIWWKRVHVEENIQSIITQTLPIDEVGVRLLFQSKQWQDLVDESMLQKLEQVLSYRNMKGEEFEQPLYQVLLHLFNHQTYHRGQIVTMLRQVRVEAIPATDFILWSRVVNKM